MIFIVLLVLVILLISIFYFISSKKETFTNNNIDKIYVINLKKNQDRLEKFMENAKKANIEVERFDAVYGQELSKDHPDILKYFVKDHGLISGQIGCALSHIKIWEDAINNNYNNIIVFEDDAIIPEDFWDKFNKAYNELPNNWDMLLLSINTGYGELYNNKLIKLKMYEGNYGLIGYLLNINFIKKIVNNKFNNTVDTFLRDKYYYNNIYKVFLINPLLINHDYTFYSDNFNKFRNDESHKNNVIKKFNFIHIPKTGGSSFKKKFKKYMIKEKHCDSRPINNIYNIAIIRNPYERFVSIFRHIKDRETMSHAKANDLVNFTDIEDFCNSYFDKKHPYHSKTKYLLTWNNTNINNYCENYGCNLNDKCIHWAPQSYFVTDVSKVQALLKLDTINEDIKKLYDKNILDHESIPNINKSKSKNFEISPIVKKLVDTVYKNDFKLYEKAGL